MMNVWGLVASYLLIFIVIGISTFLQKKHIVSDEGARKFIHIGVSNWWILAMYFFSGNQALWFAMIAPVTFIVINYYSYRHNILKAMERGGKGNLGTVYFPISLLILVVFTFGILKNPFIGAVGILIMGYGDGLSAIIGKTYGKHKIINGKSIEGSITMFVVSFVIAFFISTMLQPINTALIIAIGIAALATVVELVTPKGLDNLTVPLSTSFVFYLFLLLISMR